MILDIGLPVEDGYSLIARIRELETAQGSVLVAAWISLTRRDGVDVMNAPTFTGTELPPSTRRFVHDLRNCLFEQVQEILDLLDEFIGRPKVESDIPSAAPRAGTEPLKVLIADDNADAAHALATYLRLSGHRPVVAFDGGEALRLAADELPDVIMVDLTMPTLNGYDVARSIRAQPWGSSVRLIAVSGWISPEEIDRVSHAGFDAHMSKPIDLEKLPSVLQAAH